MQKDLTKTRGTSIYFSVKYLKQQILQIVAAVLFLIGAAFMLVNTFADQVWSFWTGLGFAIAATAIYIWQIVESRIAVRKKLGQSSYSHDEKTESYKG